MLSGREEAQSYEKSHWNTFPADSVVQHYAGINLNLELPAAESDAIFQRLMLSCEIRRSEPDAVQW